MLICHLYTPLLTGNKLLGSLTHPLRWIKAARLSQYGLPHCQPGLITPYSFGLAKFPWPLNIYTRENPHGELPSEGYTLCRHPTK
jgi:hypothetical protein